MGQNPFRLRPRSGTGAISQVPYPDSLGWRRTGIGSGLGDATLNPLICLSFDTQPAQSGEFLLRRNMNRGELLQKISLANFSFLISLHVRADFVRLTTRRAKMAWKTPKIVEVPVGMEINMYACAARK
jgi:coenzyme PQQ precursor peptide PqqA